MIMERIIQIVAGLPNHSKTREALTNDFIDQLWNSLDHPPLLYMGDKFKWRQPDGSFNVSPTAQMRLPSQLTAAFAEPANAKAWCWWSTLLEDSEAEGRESWGKTRPRDYLRSHHGTGRV